MGQTYISPKEVKTETPTDRDLEAGVVAEAMVGLFTGLLIMAYSMSTIETENQLPILL